LSNIASAIIGNQIDEGNSYTGTLTSTWGTATIRTGTNTESIIILPPDPAAGNNLKNLNGNIGFGIVLNAYGTSGSLFKGTLTNPICIEIKYNEAQLGNIDENTLQLYISSDNGNTWETISCGLDLTNNIISGTFSHLSIIAPAGKSKQIAASNLNNVIAYPNPCKGYDKITFKNLTNQCRIRIYNIAAERIYEKELTNTNGSAEWNCKGIASGVYIYIITNDKGQKATGKIGIVK
jgi:hypothetical protein